MSSQTSQIYPKKQIYAKDEDVTSESEALHDQIEKFYTLLRTEGIKISYETLGSIFAITNRIKNLNEELEGELKNQALFTDPETD